MLKTEMLKAEMGHGLTRTGTEGGRSWGVVGSVHSPEVKVPFEQATHCRNAVSCGGDREVQSFEGGACTRVTVADHRCRSYAQGIEHEQEKDNQPSRTAVSFGLLSWRGVCLLVGLVGHGGIEAQAVARGKGGAG